MICLENQVILSY